MPNSEQMLPVLVLFLIERAKFRRRIVVLLQNHCNHVFKIVEILFCFFFHTFVVVVSTKIHEFDLALKGNADVVGREVTVRDAHVVEEGVHS